MPKVANELGALDVKRITHPGGRFNCMVAVGGVSGLYLQITPNGGKTWVLRMRVGEKRRDYGLGGFPTVGHFVEGTLRRERDCGRTISGALPTAR